MFLFKLTNSHALERRSVLITTQRICTLIIIITYCAGLRADKATIQVKSGIYKLRRNPLVHVDDIFLCSYAEGKEKEI